MIPWWAAEAACVSCFLGGWLWARRRPTISAQVVQLRFELAEQRERTKDYRAAVSFMQRRLRETYDEFQQKWQDVEARLPEELP